MSDTTTPTRRGKPADNGTAATLTPAVPDAPPSAEAPAARKPPRKPAPIDPETRAMRKVESLLLELAESDPTAPLRVLDYLAERRRSRATFAPLKPEYPHAGPS